MTSESPAATTKSRITEIKARVTVAEREGWYGYEQEARDDVRFLLSEVQRLRDELVSRLPNQYVMNRRAER